MIHDFLWLSNPVTEKRISTNITATRWMGKSNSHETAIFWSKEETAHGMTLITADGRMEGEKKRRIASYRFHFVLLWWYFPALYVCLNTSSCFSLHLYVHKNLPGWSLQLSIHHEFWFVECCRLNHPARKHGIRRVNTAHRTMTRVTDAVAALHYHKL